MPTAKSKSRVSYIAGYGQRALQNYEASNGVTVPVGEQVRFSHIACGDTRDRLYVKRVVNEKGQAGVIAYCHNCGEGGCTKDSIAPQRPMAPRRPASAIKDAFPGDFEPPNQLVLDYMARYGFTETDAAVFGVGWSDHYQRVVLPVRDSDDPTIKGCQLRRVGDYGAKYLTMRPTSEPLECMWGRAMSVPTVIVEDLLSAWRVWQAGFSALPLLGSHVRPERLAKLVHEGRKEWVVWLDNDKPEIDDAARYMVNLIRAFGATAHLCHATHEPKHCDIDTAKSVIEIHP